jgi:putative ABC transport system permease protein
MISLLYEILNSIRRNKLRTFLTGFSVAWGIFMLIILLGSGNGLKNAFGESWSDMLVNAVKVFGGRTNIPYAGFQSGRRITLDNKDMQFSSEEFSDEVIFTSGHIWTGSKTISFGTEYLVSSLEGGTPHGMLVDGVKILQGRYVNELDMHEKRKIIILPQRTKDILFGHDDAIGKNVNVEGVIYTVAGVYSVKDRSNERGAIIPLSTAQVVYNRGINISSLSLVLSDKIDDKPSSDAFMNRYKKRFASRHHISPDDDNAIWYWNRFESHLEMSGINNIINIAVWIIGIFTLLSGIVGVSNIMLITVRERTREFGIRKSIGASPWSILTLVVLESIVITTVFGYIGLVCGVGLTELLAGVFASGGDSLIFFVNPTVDITVAVQATALLVIAGTLAGFFPALKAVKIKTIEALNNK